MTDTNDLPLRLTRAELAAFWRVSARTLQRREALGISPQPMRFGGRLLYRREDVLAAEHVRITVQSEAGECLLGRIEGGAS